MLDPEATAARLHALKALGVRIAIDDFGTGYSSLGYLRQFPVDSLKIDRSFVTGIAGSEQSAALIHTLVQLGKSLDIETLAEGIEDKAQLGPCSASTATTDRASSSRARWRRERWKRSWRLQMPRYRRN